MMMLAQNVALKTALFQFFNKINLMTEFYQLNSGKTMQSVTRVT